jgi:hypothetical protein
MIPVAKRRKIMLKSFKNGVLTLAVLATTVISGFAQPAEAQNYFGNQYGYYPQANYVNPYYGNPYNNGNQYYGRRRSILKPALIGAGIGGAAGLGVSLLSRNDGHSRHYVRNIGIGAGVGAGVGALTGLIRR